MTAETYDVPRRLAEKHVLSLWDAPILASAQAAGCTVLVIEDLQHGQRFGRLTVRNPFRA